jgi:hypothetical protein
MPYARGSTSSLTSRSLVLAWLIGLLELAGGMLLAIWLLTSPSVFRLYYPAIGHPAHHRDATRIVEWLHGNDSAAALNSQLRSGALTLKELRHYADVRNIFQRLPNIFWGAVLFGAILVIFLKPSAALIQAAQYRGLVALFVLLAASAIFTVWDWKVFFACLHYPFFGATSWKLSNSAYSLQLFPNFFWQLAGVTVCVLPAIIMLATTVGLRALNSSRGSKGQCPRAVGGGPPNSRQSRPAKTNSKEESEQIGECLR